MTKQCFCDIIWLLKLELSRKVQSKNALNMIIIDKCTWIYGVERSGTKEIQVRRDTVRLPLARLLSPIFGMQPAKVLPDWPRICGFGYSIRICTWKWCSSPDPVSVCTQRSCRSFPSSRSQKSFPFLRYQSNALYRWDFEQALPLGVRFWMLRWCTDFLGRCEKSLRESSSRIAMQALSRFGCKAPSSYCYPLLRKGFLRCRNRELPIRTIFRHSTVFR